MLGAKHLRVLTIKGFPPFTHPGVLDDLNAAAMTYRWMTRYLCLDREESERELVKWRRLWFSKHKSMGALVKEMLTKEAATFANPDAIAKSEEVDEALQELGSELIGFGFLTSTLVVMGDNGGRRRREAAHGRADHCVARLRHRRRNAQRGRSLAVEPCRGTPGPMSAIPWSRRSTSRTSHRSRQRGPATRATVTSTRRRSLSRKRTDRRRSGSTFMSAMSATPWWSDRPARANPSCSSFLALQWRRFAGVQDLRLRQGRIGARRPARHGRHAIDLGGDGVAAFQPLARIDTPNGRADALNWVMTILAQEGLPDTPEVKEPVWSALGSLRSAPPEQRHLTGLRLLVQNAAVQAALLPYTQEGAMGGVFDGAEDRLNLSDIVLFEMEEIMARPKAAAPALLHLFDRLEERFDGSPTLLILDEAWLFLDSPIFAARIREWLKTLRKKNVAVVFATQSLADIAESAIAPALIESCPTRIYLPNERAFEPQQRQAYERFGLNETEIDLIATAQRKRHYYYASPSGRRLFELALGPIALAFCAAADPAIRALMTSIERQPSAQPFWRRFLIARQLGWVLDALDPADPPATAPSKPLETV